MGPMRIRRVSDVHYCDQPLGPRSDGTGYHLCGRAAVILIENKGDHPKDNYILKRCVLHAADDLANAARMDVCVYSDIDHTNDWNLRVALKAAFQTWITSEFDRSSVRVPQKS